MADPIVITQRRIVAQDRLVAACTKLAKAVGVDPPVKPPLLIQDSEFRAMQDLESMANFVDSLNAALGPKETPKPAAAAKPSPVSPPKPAAATPPKK